MSQTPPPAAREALTFVSRPSLAELTNAGAALNRSGLAANGFGGFAATWAVIAIALGAPAGVIVLEAAVAAILLSGYYTAPFTWFLALTRRDLVLAPATITVDDDGLTVQTAQTTGRHAWSVYRRARDLGSSYGLLAGWSMGALVPKAGMSRSDEDRFRQLLDRHGLLRTTPAQQLMPFVWLGLGAAVAVGQYALRL